MTPLDRLLAALRAWRTNYEYPVRHHEGGERSMVQLSHGNEEYDLVMDLAEALDAYEAAPKLRPSSTVTARPVMTNAIAGPQTGRGVR